VQHADATLTNILLDNDQLVSGVVDFGDMHHTAAVCDTAVSLTAVLRNSGPLRVPWTELAAAFLDGYQRVRPLWPEEAAVLGHLVLARLVTTLDISRERADEHPDNRGYIVQYDQTSTALLDELVGLDDDELAYRFSRLAGLATRSATGDLRQRRDTVLGGRLAGNHLRERGHERVAFVGGPASIRQVADRRKGFTAALRGEADVQVVATPNLTVTAGRKAGAQIADLSPAERPTAVFCANDLLALGVLQEMTLRRLRVPRDVAILGYDDIDFAAAAAVPLSSIRQPREQLGRAAAELLLEEANQPDRHEHRHVVFEPELVVRESSARARNGRR